MKMWRGEEGKECGVTGCPNASVLKRRSKGRRLFGLPRVRVPHKCEADRQLTKRWRAAWVAALRASGTNCENDALRKMMVCARHFVSGISSHFSSFRADPTLFSAPGGHLGQSAILTPGNKCQQSASNALAW
jgi:hypothetical protein